MQTTLWLAKFEQKHIYPFIRAKNFICRWMVRQCCSFVQNLVANYHLVVFYPQQYHIAMCFAGNKYLKLL